MQSIRLRYLTLCVICLALLSGNSHATERTLLKSSTLQRWITTDLLSYLTFEFNNHPRFKGQKLAVKAEGGDRLAAALHDTLQDRLLNVSGLQLVSTSARSNFNPTGPNSIDDLTCNTAHGADYYLRLSVTNLGTSKTEVRLLIEDAASGAAVTGFGKQWQGRLSRHERRLQRQKHSARTPLGTTDQPYRASQPELAARHLALHIACGLRPEVGTVTAIYWQAPAVSSISFDNTLTIARHYLHSFREFTLAQQPQQADVTLQPQEAPLGPGLHQLWLTGVAANSNTPLPGVNAVAYMAIEDRAAGVLHRRRIEQPGELTAGILPPAIEPAPPTITTPRSDQPNSDPLDALQVNVVEVEQKTRRGQRADLYFTLRIRNQSDWPIAYSFTLSGGHFDRCRPYNRDYRHEKFGTLRETIGPGETQVEELVIRDLQHNPGRLSSRHKCAGVVDLDGFEKFALRGNKVIDYVNWSL
ncbi:hypothetical protein FKG94_27030 [Exilibacterium tricleocarpae]|uniref:Uncharacterized protein n=1 Tax=Exilibacterium tricleocarpae TaxID=2591008 RepID=A0A545SNE6_9GAMM|nr:hypothetical protein [Exilibacterium tricleocarpae]TQV66489.1 hypothetical protein FKG94_27030 [Exilibacterium tricleocarpae]